MRAVDAIIECLKAEGVDAMFGIPGGANLPTYDAIVGGGVRHILVRHEAGGGHAAEGYAKATGKVETRSSTLVSPNIVLMRPSCGLRFSAMSIRDKLLMRGLQHSGQLLGTISRWLQEWQTRILGDGGWGMGDGGSFPNPHPPSPISSS